jgi:hypothetical protein
VTSDDREEAHVQAIADGIREALASTESDDDVSQLVEAAMGDEAAADLDDEPSVPARSQGD